MADDLQRAVERFLYDEAALLDEWRLDEWAALFTEDGSYHVPAPDEPDGSPNNSVFLVVDDIRTLRSRADQLMGKFAWAEHPRSKTRHLVTNVRILESHPSQLKVAANFMVSRYRFERTDTYYGRYEYKLVLERGSFRIAERKAWLDQDTLRPQATLSIIV